MILGCSDDAQDFRSIAQRKIALDLIWTIAFVLYGFRTKFNLLINVKWKKICCHDAVNFPFYIHFLLESVSWLFIETISEISDKF